MKLTEIFKREFFYTLTNYHASKADAQAVITMPNCSRGALKIGRVTVASASEYNKFMKLMEDLTKRVFRTGLNSETVSGTFRLPIKNLDIDPATQFIYTLIDTSYPTDSHRRFVTFLKSLYVRLAKSQLDYAVMGYLRLDQLVLGAVLDKKAVDYTAFHERFKAFPLGFAIFEQLIIKPKDASSEMESSVFFFDHADNEPLIGAQNHKEESEHEDEL